MKRIALVSSEPIRERMAGIGIRYLELARRLPAAAGVETVLISPAPPEESERALAAAAEREEGGAAAGDGEVGAPAAVRRFAAAELPRLLADCDAVVAQGQLANDLLLAGGERPVAVDLYDPWLVENLALPFRPRPRPLPQRPRDLGASALARRPLPLLVGGAAHSTTWGG
jgi:hypothetical protein